MKTRKCDCCGEDVFCFDTLDEYHAERSKLVKAWRESKPPVLTNERAAGLLEEMAKLHESGLAGYGTVRRALLKLGVFVMPEFSVEGVPSLHPTPLYLGEDGEVHHVRPSHPPECQPDEEVVKA